MPISLALKDRLASGPSREGLAPLVAVGAVGLRVARSAVTLRAELDEPRAGGLGLDGMYMQLSDTQEVTDALSKLLRANAPEADVVVEVFGHEPTPALEDFQQSFLQTIFGVVLLQVAAGDFSPDRLNDLIRVGASASAAGGFLRGLLTTQPSQPTVVDKPFDTNPIIPGLPDKLLITAERLRRMGGVNAVKGALTRWGAAVGAATPRYLVDAINALEPPDGCPGEWATIRGAGFGDGSRASVVFTGAGDSPLVVDRSDVRSWTDSEITVRIPKGAVSGPVGILIYPDLSGGPSLAQLGSTAIGDLGDYFGAAATANLQNAMGKLAPPVSAPKPPKSGATLFTGGMPVVQSFAVSPSRMLWPRRTITLSWSVENTLKVEIVARNVAGSAAHELPPITGLTHHIGSTSVTVPGTRTWSGEYVLRVTNRCGTIESAIQFDMAVRRGLALGGGGTRGDFQVGALLYLYNEKGYRPDAIAGTSVGAVNAVDLVMGDDPATATSPARSAASRLSETWLGLMSNTDMWLEEPWLANAKSKVRQAIRSLSTEGLLALPYAVISNSIAANDLDKLFKAKGQTTALFNMQPIKDRMTAAYDQTRTRGSGIKLRLVAVSLESTELVLVNENGAVLERGAIVHRPAFGVPVASPTDVIDGAMASASMPGIFPAVRLNNNMCVDGGMREQVPAQVAVRDLGCNQVYSLRVSAAPEVLETNPGRAFGDIATRALLVTALDEISDDDVDPFNGWGDGVTVTDIRPTFNLHDGLVVDPGLIRISMDYGWMRAADVIDAAGDATAHELTDQIILLRVDNWMRAHWAAGLAWMDPNRGFTDLMFSGISVSPGPRTVPAFNQDAVEAIRDNCLKIRELLRRRLQRGAPTPPTAVRTAWFTEWEVITDPMATKGPWAEYTLARQGFLTAAPEPAPI